MNPVFDHFLKQELPTMILCTPNRIPVVSLKSSYNIVNTIRYNALSDLEFDFPQSSDGGVTYLPAYELLRNKMVVLIKDIGYYIINECPEDSTGMVPVKHITCQSAESSMLYRRVTGFTVNTIDDPGKTDFTSLMDILMQYFPGWTIDTIDPDIITDADGNTVYREVAIDNSTLYNTLIEKVEVAYNCVFSFDTFNKTISVTYIPNLDISTNQTGVFISFNNLAKSINITEFSDEMSTALYCYGADGIDIRSVNPIGTEAIYDFSYYKSIDWMAQDLIDAITTWEALLAQNETSYSAFVIQLNEALDELAVLQAELTEYKAVLDGYLISLKAAKSQKLGSAIYAPIEANVADQKVEISNKEEEIALKNSEINTCIQNMNIIVCHLQFNNTVNLQSFINQLADTYQSFTTLSKSWQAIYFSTSTAPGFDLESYESLTPQIEADLYRGNIELGLLTDMVQAAMLLSRDLTEDEITSITDQITVFLNYINSLFNSFSVIIPNTNTTNNLNTITSELSAYYTILEYASNFTDLQYLNLQDFIYDNTYVNEFVAIYDTMTKVEQQAQIQSLYTQGKTVLARVSKPRYEISGDFANIFALPEYTDFVNKVELGKSVTVEIRKDRVVECILLEMEITYDNPTEFNLVFGNRARLNNSNFRFSDMFIDSAEQASSVSGTGG